MEATIFYLFFIIGLAEIRFGNGASDWTYTGDTGITRWHELFPKECAGRSQSPIDIKPEETIYNADLKDFAIWYDPPRPDSKLYIHNNGHTVQVDLVGEFFVTNAGLPNVYKALQFHFHWGHNEKHGSEHLIDGVAGPIEMHLVTYNQELYSEIGQAVISPGGLAVLGTMYEISEEDNPNLDTVVRALKYIRDPELDDKVELPLVSLRDFLPKDLSRYYRYNGSLTTPGCFESVIWTVFDEKQTISLAQLREFTLLLQHKQKKKGSASRHRRSLDKAERKREQNAKHVLDELGIRGNHFEEASLKSEMMYMKMMGDQPRDQTVVVEKKTPGEEENEEDDDHKTVDADDDVTTENRDDDDHHPTYHKVIETEDGDSKYIQEEIVNNFRPVQPLYDRVVYRNFKLRSSAKTQDDDDNEEYRMQQSNYRDNGATYQKLSLIALMVMFLCTLIFV